MHRKLIISFCFLTLLIGIFIINSDSVSAQERTVCCEQTVQGAFCQNVPQNECAPGSRSVPTSCDATSFCRAGTCYDSTEGTCADNTPQLVCNNNGGIWSEESPPQCNLGCCVLGDQAAFVSLVRCKRLSSQLGLETNYNSGIKTEAACIASVQNQERGACVFEKEFERTCKFTTRADCDTIDSEGSVEFFTDKLCSAEELGTICGPTRETILVPGKDEVYWKDSCGNPGNIYDATKVEDQEYWTNAKRKDESCGFGQSNANSRTCGNCDYLLGSFGRNKKDAGGSVDYGDYICADLNCRDFEGQERRHGESWCVADEKGDGDKSPDEARVGSRDFRYICQNGKVVSEACADFRAETCVEDSIETSSGDFSQAACRVNRWQDCLSQTREDDCLNTDRRDCTWKKGVSLGGRNAGGTCVPQTSPGLNFWASEETRAVCNQANQVCIVKYEKGLFGGEECVENCECLTNSWAEKYENLCSALGDCGGNLNWAGYEGYKDGFEIKIDGRKKK